MNKTKIAATITLVAMVTNFSASTIQRLQALRAMMDLQLKIL